MMPEVPGEEPVKICRTCRFWTEEPKGFCQLHQQAVGQFFFCGRWESKGATASEAGALGVHQ